MSRTSQGLLVWPDGSAALEREHVPWQVGQDGGGGGLQVHKQEDVLLQAVSLLAAAWATMLIVEPAARLLEAGAAMTSPDGAKGCCACGRHADA